MGSVLIDKSLMAKLMGPEDNIDLFRQVRDFIEDHVELVDDAEYDVLAAKVLESWIIDKFNEIGYIFFVGPPRSGKTRAMETLARLCYNPRFSATMSASAIYRTLDKETTTLFLDEIQQYLRTDRSRFMAILNAGQRRGEKATLTVKRDDWEVKDFEVFGSKFLASTEETAKALATRCIIITMVKNSRKVPLRIDEKRAEKIRSSLAKYQVRMEKVELPDVEPLFHNQGFSDYRNIETFINLVAITPSEYRENILNYALDIDCQIAEEERINFYAELFDAVEIAYEKCARDGKLSVQAISDVYNEGRPEQEQLSNQTIGKALNVLGLRHVTRMTNGRKGRRINEQLLIRLRRRYKPEKVDTETTNDKKGEAREESKDFWTRMLQGVTR